MKLPQRVIWGEGMFVSPQHLQQADRYHENLLAARLGAVFPYDWGVVTVELDERALVAGQLRVQRFEGILPDGLPLTFDATHPEAPPARPIEGHFGPAQRALEVFLGVPIDREGAATVASTAAPTPGLRYYTATRNVVDAGGNATEVPVAFAQRQVVVLFGDEARDDFETIKIAEVVRDASGTLVPRTDYIPPVRFVSASPWLVSSIRNLLAQAVAQQRMLAGGFSQRGNFIEFGAGDVNRFIRFHTLNSFLPAITHLTERGDVSPEHAYLLLSQFAGQLSSFVVDADPTALPKFVYTDLTTTFSRLINRVIELLGFKQHDQYIIVPLESREDGLHFGRLDDERLLRGAVYVLTVRTQLPEAQAVEEIPRISKVGAWSDINSLVQANISGVPLQVTYRPPPEIPVRAGVLYFNLIQDKQWWRNIAAERTLAIYLPTPYLPSTIKLELLAIPKASAT